MQGVAVWNEVRFLKMLVTDLVVDASFLARELLTDQAKSTLIGNNFWSLGLGLYALRKHKFLC